MARIKRNPETVKIAERILEEYQPQSIEEMQAALKEVFGPMMESMLVGEINHQLGYDKYSHEEKQTTNRRNGYSKKKLKTTEGYIDVNVPRDRENQYDPVLIEKHQSNISSIQDKVLAMYARGMSQRDIAATIEDIYGFSISHEMVSDITDQVLADLETWQARPLSNCYVFAFVDCMYTTIRNDYETKKYAVYTMLGYDITGKKEILGLWLHENESKHKWMQIFDEIKARGVQDIFFLSMDGVSGLEEGCKAIFPDVVVQRCIVHLIRNAIKYVPSKDYKPFTASLKKVYGAPSLKAFQANFDSFKKQYAQYSGAIAVWERNIAHVEQLFDYPAAIRKIMYTTNAVEAVNSSFRKVTKKGAFPNENALLKLLYLRITELDKKWENGKIVNWAMVMNQLLTLPQFQDKLLHYQNEV